MIETTKQTRNTVDAILDWLVGWKFWLEVAAYVLGAVLLVIGGLTLLANREDGRRQERTILELRKGVADSEARLEEERIKRATLVETLFWRSGLINLPSDWWRKIQEENSLSIRDVPHIQVSIVCLRQLEPMWVAHDLAIELQVFPFRLTEISIVDDELPPGIRIERKSSVPTPDNFCLAACDAIIAGFKELLVPARDFPAEELGDNRMTIVIGASDRLSGPRFLGTAKEIEDGAPWDRLPAPVSIKNDKGEAVRFTFPAPADQGTPSAAGTSSK